MKKYILIIKTIVSFSLLATVGLVGPVLGQGGMHGGERHAWPESLEIIEITGTVLIEYSLIHPQYFLDEDSDGAADYNLSFGPWWYEPGDGVDRPEEGVTVSIGGALRDSAQPISEPTIIVFDLDGEEWRVPIEYGRFGWNAEPFWSTSNDTMTVSGIVSIDTTYFYNHYYLDTDGDSLPEYQLGFGPEWYEPASRTARPENGVMVTIFGLKHDRHGIDLLTVIRIDGLDWRPLGEPAPWAGDWMARDHSDSTRAFCMNNQQSWIDFPPDNFGMGMGGHHWPDSMFVQFWDIHPDSLPGMFHDRIFNGYHIQVQDSDRSRMMDGRFGGEHCGMRFEEEHHVRFQYYDEDLASRNFTEENITVLVWDEVQSDWKEVTEVSIDQTDNVITFESADLAGYYALASEATGTAVEDFSELQESIVLSQNFPNPFNPKTNIPYVLTSLQHVTLEVFDIVGRKVAILIDGVQAAGEHSVVFDSQGLPSGVYIYQLQGSSHTLRRELILMK